MGFPPALPPERTWFPLVELAVGEDIGAGDATTPLVVEAGRQGSAIIEARQPLVVCGLEVAAEVFAQVASELRFDALQRDGDSVTSRVSADLDMRVKKPSTFSAS